MKKEVDFRKLILDILAVSGLVAMTVVAPNAIQALDKLGLTKKRKYYPAYINQRIKQLQKSGYVSFKKNDGIIYIEITDKGERLLDRYRLESSLTERKRGKWDGQWRIIIFDVKEQRRRTRNQLRQELNNFGFTKLQNSVWVSPYPCEEFITLLKADLQIGKDVLYITANQIEGDYKLKKLFDLK